MKHSIAIALIIIAAQSNASTFMCDGKEVKKGQAIIGIAKGNFKECLKIDKVELSDKGTLKAISN